VAIRTTGASNLGMALSSRDPSAVIQLRSGMIRPPRASREDSILRATSALSVAAMLLWGIAYVPSAWLVETWPPLGAAGARLAVGGVVLLGMLLLAGRPVLPGASVATIGWLALTQTVLFYGATFWGIAHAGAGLSAVLANTDPLFVAALATLFLGERLGRVQWIGLGVGLIGAACVVWEGPLWPPDVSSAALVVVGGALAWSVGTVVASRSMRGEVDPLALAGWQMGIGGLVLLFAGGLAREEAPAAGWREATLILSLGIFCSAAPLALFYIALMRAPASEVSVWFFLIPVVGVLTAWPLLGEVPDLRLLVGLGGVSFGLWLVLGGRAPGGDRLVDSPMPP
jgi:drug/metabolite transporter (DMT)-like permease